MASTHADLKIRALHRRARELSERLDAMIEVATRGAINDPAILISLGRTRGVADAVLRMSELLVSGGLPVSLLSLIERECDTMMEGCKV